MKTMKEMALEFSRAFERPVNESPVQLTVTERELLGRLIFEECVEYVTLGLGLQITYGPTGNGTTIKNMQADKFNLELNEGQRYDPIESADGLGDLNVLVHFNSLWHGFDIEAVTREIFLSNMSKLDGMGRPIINECQVEPDGCDESYDEVACAHLLDLSKPRGKILKGPNYFPPDIAKAIGISQEGAVK